jgi:hypothetical protein
VWLLSPSSFTESFVWQTLAGLRRDQTAASDQGARRQYSPTKPTTAERISFARANAEDARRGGVPRNESESLGGGAGGRRGGREGRSRNTIADHRSAAEMFDAMAAALERRAPT